MSGRGIAFRGLPMLLAVVCILLGVGACGGSSAAAPTLLFRPVYCQIASRSASAAVRPPVSEKDCALPHVAALPTTPVSGDIPTASVVLAASSGTSRYVLGPADLDTGDVMTASAVAPRQGQPGYTVDLRFTAAGAATFNKVAAQRYRYANPTSATPDPRSEEAICVEGKVFSVPVIDDPRFGGSAEISGNLTERQATSLVQMINAANGRVSGSAGGSPSS